MTLINDTIQQSVSFEIHCSSFFEKVNFYKILKIFIHDPKSKVSVRSQPRLTQIFTG